MTATIVFKVNRPTWDETEHPRDRLGRFIETGAEVNIWGGSTGTVVRNVGGGRIEVARVDGVHVIVHRNYLTVTARPDGSAPTSDPEAVEAAPAKPATPDAETLPDPTVDSDPTTTGAFQVADFLDSEDPKLADKIRFTSADLHMALTNGVPDDEADERAALFELLDQAAAEHSERAEDVAAVHAAAEADGAPTAEAPSPPETPATTPAADAGASDPKQRVADAFDGVIAQEGAESPQGAMLGAARTMWQGGFGDAARAAIASLGVDTPAHQELTDALAADAKPVYAGRDTGGPNDEQTRSDGGTPLPTVAPAGVRADQGPGDVLPGPGDRGAESDRGAGTDAGGDTPGGRVDGGPDRQVDLRPADSGVDGDTGVPAPGTGDDTGATGPDGQGTGVGGERLRGGPAGVGDTTPGGATDQPVTGPDETPPEPRAAALSRMTPQEQAQEFATRVAQAGDEWEAVGRANSATGPSDVTVRNLDSAIARWRTALANIGAEQPPDDRQRTVDAARGFNAYSAEATAPAPVEPDWRELGRQAFRDGQPAQPHRNPDVQAALDALPVGSPDARRAITAEYMAGWNEANLAATATDAPTPEAPPEAPPPLPPVEPDWRELGRQAFHAGELASPALSPDVQAAVQGLPVGSPEGRHIMAEYADGWQEANLAAPVPGITPDPGWGELYGTASEPSYTTPDGPLWMFRRGQRVRFYNADGEQVGPEQTNVAPAVAYAHDQGWWPGWAAEQAPETSPAPESLPATTAADEPAPTAAPPPAQPPSVTEERLREIGGLSDAELEAALEANTERINLTSAMSPEWDGVGAERRAIIAERDSREAAAINAPEPAPPTTARPFPQTWAEVQPGDRIRVGYEGSAHDGTVIRVENPDQPTVIYRRDSGARDQFAPGPTQRPRPGQTPAPPTPANVDLAAEEQAHQDMQRRMAEIQAEADAYMAAPPPVPEPAAPSDAGEAPAPDVTEADQPAPDVAQVQAVPDGGTMFQPTSVDDLAPAGAKAKLTANLEALRTLRQLQAENRPATPDEQATLAKWAGWGGLPEVFDDTRPEYAEQRAELRTLLSEAEWREASRNTLNAHYTDARVVEALWKATEDLGFDGGRVLEPGSGSGTFIGFAPDDADMVGVELDSTTAAISQYLYPDATIRNESFADTTVPDGSFDATVGNVPFGQFALTDRTHNRDGESIHNHFILKSLALTRPGGLVTLLTSRYTLDSQRSSARAKMAEMADLVGAVRLPTGSHQRAAGTAVIEDALIFRRREPDAEPQEDQSWVTSTVQNIDGQQIAVNDYWATHPQNVLGEVHAEKGQFGTGELVVRGDKDMTTLPSVLTGIVAQAKADGLTATPRSADALPTLVELGAGGRHEGDIQAEPDGTFTQATSGAIDTIPVPKNQAEELRKLIGLRDALSTLLAAESASAENTPEIDELRADLNRLYDRYVARYGPVNRYKVGGRGQRITPGQGGFRRDPMSAIVRGLETYDPVTGTAAKASIFTKRAVAPRELRTSADNPADALTLSMDNYGEVNLPVIASMLDVDEDEARAQLGNLVYEQPPLTDEEQQAAHEAAQAAALADDPDAPINDAATIAESVRATGGLTPAAEYLSGDVRRKLAVAQAAARADARFQPNVAALQAIIPPDLGPDEIDGRLGAAWIDATTVKAFLSELLDDRYNQVSVSHSGGAIWSVVAPRYGTLANETWGTDARTAGDLVQSMLEQRAIKVTHKVGDKTVPDLDATLAAQAKAEEIQERFSEWLWEDPDRARILQARYNDQFNGIVLRSYKGSTRQFPGMSEHFKPHDHVVDAVERIVNEPTALLAHVVGAGKTAEMVMGSAELKRLGLARKPAIVIPNHMLEQFSREYLQIYPNAKILAAGSDDLQGDKRREFVARAATGDWDAIIITKNAFESIPMSPTQVQAYIDREMATMRAQLEAARENPDGTKAQERTVKKMEKALLRAEEALKKKLGKSKDVGVSFEQTGIDYLMVDEAHNYSNLRTLSNIQGAGTTGSDLATDLHMKMEYLRQTSQSGRVATFATGTPIRNTVTQAYVMQKFLRPDLLEAAGIHSFDQWAATFGSTVDEMELKPEGTGFRQTTRFAKFRNVPELLRMFHTFADVKLAEDLNLPTPHLVGGKVDTVVVPASDELRDYIRNLGDRAELVRSGGVEPEVDNMLKISTDGRKAALSMELVGGTHQPGKIEGAADRIARIWENNKGAIYSNPDTGEDDEIPGGLQIVFLDMGTPGSGGKPADGEAALDDLLGGSTSGWNGYDTLKAELVSRGMDPKSIRYIHEAKNDAQKAELFAAARNGRISVLVGSSEKMGVGTNMQRRAIALHDLDAPWRPADVEQRHGRIMRQGNLNPDVEIIRYVTEHSFDAYMWQTLERKAKFINQVMRGTLDVREIEDVGDTAMSYAEVKALATGNPDLLDKAKVDTLLTKLERLSRAHARTQSNLRADVQRQTVNAAQWDANAVALDAAIQRRTPTAGDQFAMSIDGQELDARADAAETLTEALQNVLVRDRWGDAPERTVARIGGFDVTAQIMFAVGGNRNVVLRFDGVPGEITHLNSTELAGAGRGLISRIENGLTGFEDRRNRTLQSAERAREEIVRAESRIGADFAREAELIAARAKSERLAAKMERDAKRAEGVDIPFDPHIDSAQFDDPILGPANDDVGPPEATTPPPAAAPSVVGHVPAAEVQEGDRVQFVAREVSGEMAEGIVESARTAGNFRMVTIRDDAGKVYTRAYALDAEVVVMVGGNAPLPQPPADEAAAPATAEESFAKLEEALTAARADDQADGHRFTRERETPDGPVYDLYEWRDGEAVLAYAGRPLDDTRGWLDGVDARIAELVHARMEGRDPAPTVLPELVGA